MRTPIFMVLVAVFLFGCAYSPANPTVPDISGGDEPATTQVTTQVVESDGGPYRLWGEFNLFINAEHDRVDVVPRRDLHVHLNALKFLEQYCTDCVQITNINNNGDGTIDLTVRITHPFNGYPEYTGFDVKGIIMFNASHDLPYISHSIYPYGDFGDPSYLHISWAELGDPEVLNPDGYSVHWTPWWDSGSDMPVFNYWPGKYSFGPLNANINAYLDFYTDEERHMFRVDGQAERTYHIWLPSGPISAGYAVEACWVPPTVTPVTDPLNDFPISANQEEPYYFQYIVNNDEPVTFEPCCGADWDCSDLRMEYAKWYGEMPSHVNIYFDPYPDWTPHSNGGLQDCDCNAPPDVHCLAPNAVFLTNVYEDGSYRGVAVLYHSNPDLSTDSIAYDVFDYTIDLE